MAIIFTDIDSGTRISSVRALKLWILGCIESEGRRLGEVTIALCSDSYIERENGIYLSHHYATDILTFSYNEGDIVSGDLLISVDTVRRNGEEYGVGYLVELHRVIIHGVLHLLGYDDVDDSQRAVMREREDYYLGILNF